MPMYYLERLEFDPDKRPAFSWHPIYRCPERWPLALFLANLDKHRYRIAERPR